MRHLFISCTWRHDQKRYQDFLAILNERFNYDCHMLNGDLKTDEEKKNDIRAKVDKCHCIVILGGYYEQDKNIIEMEISASGEYTKPVVTIGPEGVDKVSPRLREKSNDVVPWTTRSITSVIDYWTWIGRDGG